MVAFPRLVDPTSKSAPAGVPSSQPCALPDNCPGPLAGSGSRTGEEICGWNVEGNRQPVDVINRQVDLSSLDGADIGAMDVRPIGELFLADAKPLPTRPQVRRKDQS